MKFSLSLQVTLRTFCKDAKIAVVAYASFGCGHLLAHPKVVLWSERENVAPAVLLLRWALDHNMCVIPKSENPQRIQAMSPAVVLSQSLSAGARAELEGIPQARKFCWDPAVVRE